MNPDGSVNQIAVEQFSAQGVPNAEATLTPSSGTTVPAAIVELLKKIGPAILMVHSQAGQFADTAVGLRPDLIKMMIHVESNCRNGTPFTQAQIDGYKKVPSILYVHGDNVINNPVSTGQPRLTFCTSDMNAINSAGGNATLVQLPDVGIKGNDHMLMQDLNNLEVADWLIGEITKEGFKGLVSFTIPCLKRLVQEPQASAGNSWLWLSFRPAFALWSPNAGLKAIIDALNVV